MIVAFPKTQGRNLDAKAVGGLQQREVPFKFQFAIVDRQFHSGMISMALTGHTWRQMSHRVHVGSWITWC